jgi:hypothetical protein
MLDPLGAANAPHARKRRPPRDRAQPGVELGHHVRADHDSRHFLYLILQAWRRRAVGWDVFERPSAEHAAEPSQCVQGDRD